MVMRKIDSIIVHCSATKAGMDFNVTDIDRWHRARGLNGVGYHYVIRLDGSVETGRDITAVGAHCPGWNERSVGICYIGGLDANGRPADTRTEEQKETMKRLIEELKRQYPIVTVIGHRDTSPDLNGDGRIEPNEFIKSCPCFDVKKWMAAFIFPFLFGACGSTHSQKNRHVEIDSTVVVAHDKMGSCVRKAELETLEQVNEYIEETVFAWEADTIGGNRVKGSLPQKKYISVTRKVIDRGKVGLQKVQSDCSFVETDSSVVAGKTLIKIDNREEKQKIGQGGIWKLGMAVGFLILLILFFRKIFVIDNQ